MKYTIARGNAFDGIRFYGVFDTADYAILRAKWLFQGSDEWYIVTINGV